MTLANKAIGNPTEATEPDPAAAQPNRRRIAANFVTLASTSVLGLIVAILISLAIAALPHALDRYWWLELLAGTIMLGGCLAAFERQLIRRVIRGVLARHAD